MRMLCRYLLAGLLFAAPLCAQAEPIDFTEKLDIGISTDEIAITSDFRGADLTIFGAIDGADAGRFLTTIKKRLEEGAFAAELGL